MSYEVTRLPGGLSTANLSSTFENCIIPGPVTVQQFVQDFNVYNSGDYTVTQTNSSSSTISAANGAGGLVNLSTGSATAANNIVQVQVATAGFNLDPNKPFWLETTFKVSDVTNCSIVIGLQTINTDGTAASNGVFFSKANGTNIVNCVEVANGSSTTVGSTLSTGTVQLHYSDHFISQALVVNTPITLGLAYNPNTSQAFAQSKFYINGLLAGGVDTSNTIPYGLNLAPIMEIKAQAAANQTLTIDYIAAVLAR